jgi:hypothetical protein
MPRRLDPFEKEWNTMRHLTLSAAVALGLALGATAQEPKQPPKEAVEKGEKALKEHLDKLKGGNAGQIMRIESGPLNELFPKDAFFAVRFRIYPVARIMPPGMKPSNVFVYADGKLTQLADAGQISVFFKDRLPAVKDDDAAKKASQAWVRLAEEFSQDGFYKFGILDEMAKVTEEGGKKKATAKAMVMAGGNGQIEVTLNFNADGKYTDYKYEAKVRAGPRPICQATKLLDPDPIVRRMAEQDLLYMGLAARDYLTEQRALAGPELRRAIDRLWQRIEKEGW